MLKAATAAALYSSASDVLQTEYPVLSSPQVQKEHKISRQGKKESASEKERERKTEGRDEPRESHT